MKDKDKAAEGAAQPEVVSAEEASRILGELSSQLDKATREVKEYKESYLRARADYDNFKKRSERDADDTIRRGKADFMKKVLDVMDDLERASGSGADCDNLRKGLELTIKKLAGVLQAEGLVPIEAQGKPFDPALHEAVAASEADVDCETVTDELRKGYTYCGSTIRPSVVRVSVPKKG